jgi:hypothetical protein
VGVAHGIYGANDKKQNEFLAPFSTSFVLVVFNTI